MKHKIIEILAIFSIAIGIIGCIKDQVVNDIDTTIINTNTISKTNNVIHNKIALICSLTKVNSKYYGGWDGSCPGTDVDAKNFKLMCDQFNIPSIKLENEQCTSDNIVNEWKYCISHLNPTNGLFIFYYSGHGGQVYGNDEEDYLDETLCFWDGQFRDDNIWKLINMQPKTTRCFMVTDCCNSGSNFQLPFDMGKSKKKIKFLSRNQEPNLLHYGGCNDGESSYGNNFGGVFTTALKKYFDKNISYKEWFDLAQKETYRKQNQKPTFAETGISFKNNKIFE